MKIRSEILLFIAYFFLGVTSPLLSNNVDCLTQEINLLQPQENTSVTLHLFLELAETLYNQDEFEKAKAHFQKALEVAQQLNDSKNIYKIYYELGRTNDRLSDYPAALEYYFKVIEDENVLLENTLKANALSKVGAIYAAMGNYEKSYKYQYQAINIHEIEKDSSGLARDYYKIGSLFYYQGNFEEALKYYQKARSISSALEDEKLTYGCLGALGSVYAELKQYDKSLKYNTLSLELARKINYKTGIAYSLGNLASLKITNNEVDTAKKMLLESLQLKEEMNDKWAIIGANLAIVEAILINENPINAIPYLNTALELSEKIGSKPRLLETYQQFTKVYTQLREFENANIYLQNYVSLKDSVLNEKTLEEMGQTKKRFELEQKENEIALLISKNTVLEQGKEIQKLQVFIFSIIVLALILVSWFSLSKLRFQRSTNHLLEEKNEKIQLQNNQLQQTQQQLVEANSLLEEKNLLLASKNDEIEVKNKLLEDSNEDLQNFAYIASHDLKEPLRMIGSYTSLLERRYKEKLDDSGKEFMFFIVDAVGRMKVMLDDLLSYSRVGSSSNCEDRLNVEDVLLVVQSNLKQQIKEQNATLIIRNDHLPEIKGNYSLMVQLMQNLISNAIKFKGEKDPEVMVDCVKKDHQYLFSIKDNGIGISEENLNKVFEMFKRLHSRQEFEGTGIGLSTCKKIVQKHGGEIWVESEDGKGSTFFFTMPCIVEELEVA